MARNIPSHISDPEVRKYLAQLNKHLNVLEKAHKDLIAVLKKNKSWTPAQKDLRKNIITAHKNISAQYRQLTPTILEVLMKK